MQALPRETVAKFQRKTRTVTQQPPVCETVERAGLCYPAQAHLELGHSSHWPQIPWSPAPAIHTGVLSLSPVPLSPLPHTARLAGWLGKRGELWATNSSSSLAAESPGGRPWGGGRGGDRKGGAGQRRGAVVTSFLDDRALGDDTQLCGN